MATFKSLKTYAKKRKRLFVSTMHASEVREKKNLNHKQAMERGIHEFSKVRRRGSSATGSVMSLNHNLHRRLSPQSLLGSGFPYYLKVAWGNRKNIEEERVNFRNLRTKNKKVFKSEKLEKKIVEKMFLVDMWFVYVC